MGATQKRRLLRQELICTLALNEKRENYIERRYTMRRFLAKSITKNKTYF